MLAGTAPDGIEVYEDDLAGGGLDDMLLELVGGDVGVVLGRWKGGAERPGGGGAESGDGAEAECGEHVDGGRVVVM